jgi:hypothetical protein
MVLKCVTTHNIFVHYLKFYVLLYVLEVRFYG